MTVYQTTYQFSPQVSIEFDEERQIYIGSMLSHGGWDLEFEGPDITSVSMQLDMALQEEFRILERSMESEKSQGRGRGGGASSRERHRDEPEEKKDNGSNFGMAALLGTAGTRPREEVAGKQYDIREHQLDTRRFANMAIMGMEYWSMIKAALGGNMLGFFSSLILMGKLTKPKFVAIVDGQRVTAPSRHKLRRAIMVKRNQIIQTILQNTRIHAQNRKLAGQSAARIRYKKKKALYLGKESWERRTSRNRPIGDWKGRVGDLQRQVKNTRDKSLDLWIGRV